MKNLHPTNKLSTNFTAEKFIVEEREGTKVRIRSKDSENSYERIVAHLKKVSIHSKKNESAEASEEQVEPVVAGRRYPERDCRSQPCYKV